MQITDRFQDNDFIRNSQLNDFVAAICDYKKSLDFKRAQRYRWHLKFKKEILLLKSFEFRLLFPYRWRCAYQNKRKTLFWFILVFRSKSRPIRSVFFFFIFYFQSDLRRSARAFLHNDGEETCTHMDWVFMIRENTK